MKMTFTNESEDGTKITLETNAVVLDDVLQEFEQFLKGCGFFFSGNIEVVDDEDSFILERKTD